MFLQNILILFQQKIVSLGQLTKNYSINISFVIQRHTHRSIPEYKYNDMKFVSR